MLGGGSLPSSIVYGTPVIFTAIVTPSGGTTNPTGTIDFVDVSDNNLDLGSVSGTPGSGNTETFILPATGVNTLQVLQAGGGVHTIAAVYSSNSGFDTSTGTLAGGLQITPAPLTFTATANTKTYDSTTSAAAIPTVSGLFGSDTVTGLAESYDTATAGSGKTMKVKTDLSPSATFTGLSEPSAMAFDHSGNLYAANYNGYSVSKFGPGATSPSATLNGL